MDTRTGRSKEAKARKLLSDDARFFFDHAGFSYNPKNETPLEGRLQCAQALARAEHTAREMGITFEWQDDWMVDHAKEYECYEDGGPQTCEFCIARDAEGNVRASLGCIDDADANYRRVIEAELADEAIDALREEGARVNA